jgi:glycosyltransferase involved in cell wall biosynthesis
MSHRPPPPFRVGIDARTLAAPKTGDRTYCLNLTRGLARVDTRNDYLLYTEHETPLADLDAGNFHQRVLPARPAWSWTPVTLPAGLRRDGCDLVHVQYIVPPRCPVPLITTVHDISFRRHPRWFPVKHAALLNLLIPLAILLARRVITGSEHTKREMVELYGTDPEKIAVTPYAADPIYRPMPREQAREAVRERFNLRQPYILSVGVLQPRKNLPRLVQAYARIAREVPQQLVLVGKEGWAFETLRRRVAGSGVSSRIRFTGYVADADLPPLYAAADLFVYPSLYEGFGLPPLEAMACGTPVVTSDTTSIPEVVGDAAVRVDPLNVDGLAGAMVEVLTSPEQRGGLIERGLQRAAQFTWEATARATLGVYEEVLGRI